MTVLGEGRTGKERKDMQAAQAARGKGGARGLRVLFVSRLQPALRQRHDDATWIRLPPRTQTGPRSLSAHAGRGARGRGRGAACSSSSPCFGPGGRRRSGRREAYQAPGRRNGTDDLLAHAALDAGPTQLKDVSARKSRGAPARDPPPPWATRTPPWKRTTTPRAPHTPEWGAPGAAQRDPRAVPAPVRPRPGPAPDVLAQLQVADDEDAAELDAVARSSGRSSGSGSGAPPYEPVGEIAYVGMPKKSKSKSRRTTKSKSSATSSTLASPPPSATSFPHGEFSVFAVASAEDDFDGTPGGFDSKFRYGGGGRGRGGFRFGGGGGRGWAGFEVSPPPFGDPSGMRWGREEGTMVFIPVGSTAWMGISVKRQGGWRLAMGSSTTQATRMQALDQKKALNVWAEEM
ncbi:hypothetical protein B0H14DRAFT_3137724 [Mycena olivaceomarginata]|nr:hypothetical protein B0H14DRAFT_3137724 [Mycena olivaceomarginata]